MIAIVLVWAPIIVSVARTPVRWVEHLLRSEGATEPSVARDPELTQVERVSVWVATVGWLLAATASGVLMAEGDLTSTAVVGLGLVMAFTGIGHATALWAWAGRDRPLAHLGRLRAGR